MALRSITTWCSGHEGALRMFDMKTNERRRTKGTRSGQNLQVCSFGKKNWWCSDTSPRPREHSNSDKMFQQILPCVWIQWTTNNRKKLDVIIQNSVKCFYHFNFHLHRTISMATLHNSINTARYFSEMFAKESNIDWLRQKWKVCYINGF